MFQLRKVKIEKLKIKSFEVTIKNTETMHDRFDMPICLIYSGFTRLKKVTGLYIRQLFLYRYALQIWYWITTAQMTC